METITNEKAKRELRGLTAFYFRKAQDLFGFSKDIPNVTFDIRGNRIAGQARFSENRIRYNLAIAKKNYEDFKARTVAHEVAHIVCHILYPRASAHGLEWKSIMRKMGVSPKRCHNYDTSGIASGRTVQKFDYVCPSCGKTYAVGKTRHNRALSGVGYRCGICKTKIVRA